jgi:hypothetical protein
MTAIREPRTVTRPVTPDECDWLPRAFTPGEVLWVFYGPTYGAVDTERGIAMSEAPGTEPFFEFPRDALDMT